MVSGTRALLDRLTGPKTRAAVTPYATAARSSAISIAACWPRNLSLYPGEWTSLARARKASPDLARSAAARCWREHAAARCDRTRNACLISSDHIHERILGLHRYRRGNRAGGAPQGRRRLAMACDQGCRFSGDIGGTKPCLGLRVEGAAPRCCGEKPYATRDLNS